MRLYGKKYFRQAIGRQVQNRTETRDAIVWDINEAWGNEWFCMVKIQGSNNQIRAKYPRGFRELPEWLRVGAPVIVRHRAGVRGYVEILGIGNTIPSPVAGGEASPITITRPDEILTGLDVSETEIGGPSMAVTVTTGTYRIDGVTYTFTPEFAVYVVMDDPAPMIMDDPAPVTMGDGEYTVAIDAAPSAGKSRYDLLEIGMDGVLDYTAGTAIDWTTEPTKPTVSADHIAVAYIFVYAGMTEITDADLGREWTYPIPASADITYSGVRITDQEMTWDTVDDTPTCDIDIQIKNQYNANQAITSGGVTASLSQLAGTGTICDPVTETWGDEATIMNFDGSETVTYERDQLNPAESSPMFQLTISGYPAVTGFKILHLLDVSGDPV